MPRGVGVVQWGMRPGGCRGVAVGVAWRWICRGGTTTQRHTQRHTTPTNHHYNCYHTHCHVTPTTKPTVAPHPSPTTTSTTTPTAALHVFLILTQSYPATKSNPQSLSTVTIHRHYPQSLSRLCIAVRLSLGCSWPAPLPTSKSSSSLWCSSSPSA